MEAESAATVPNSRKQSLASAASASAAGPVTVTVIVTSSRSLPVGVVAVTVKLPSVAAGSSTYLTGSCRATMSISTTTMPKSTVVVSSLVTSSCTASPALSMAVPEAVTCARTMKVASVVVPHW